MKNYKIAEFPTLNQFGNTLKVKRADYLKQQQKFRTDPMSFISQGTGGIRASMRISGGGRGPGGGNQNPADMRKRMEERVKDEAKKNSNPIELQ